jgi:phosphomannomutase
METFLPLVRPTPKSLRHEVGAGKSKGGESADVVMASDPDADRVGVWR